MERVTTASGTGLAGIEKRVMKRTGYAKRAGNQGRANGNTPKRQSFRPLERNLGFSHITFVHAATSASEPKHKAAHRLSPARWRAGSFNSRSMEGYYAYVRSYPVLSFHRRLRPPLFPTLPGDFRRQPWLPPLQYRADRREHLPHQRRGLGLLPKRAFDRRQGEHADDQGREDRQ